MLSHFTDYRDHTGARPDKFFKSTLFQSPRLLLGLNCLEPGQIQHAHVHVDQDKFYFVLEGQGTFVVGAETSEAGPGMVIWAPAGVDHGVTNTGEGRLVLLVGIAPGPVRKDEG
jgi:mannose-6-phosphate isomerase-like protein (cupin superfamily)